MSSWGIEPKPAWVEPPDPPRRGHARKDRRRWCRGHVDREHELGEPQVSQLGRYFAERNGYDQVCFRPEWHARRWICFHEVRCTTCGKILRRVVDVECPNFTVEITRFKTRRHSTS
jgi:hypothetical protein